MIGDKELFIKVEFKRLMDMLRNKQYNALIDALNFTGYKQRLRLGFKGVWLNDRFLSFYDAIHIYCEHGGEVSLDKFEEYSIERK
jgi:hypothetical protein